MSLISEIDAINTMLSTIGEAPITSLTGDLTADVATAQNVLTEVSRAVQGEGWDFNTFRDYTLPLDVNSKIPVPSNTLKVNVSRWPVDAVQRGGFLYNKTENAFTFTAPVEAEIVLFLPWADLPESAKEYIMHRAARVFLQRVVGADSLRNHSREDEYAARAKLMEAEAQSGNYSFLTPAVYNTPPRRY